MLLAQLNNDRVRIFNDMAESAFKTEMFKSLDSVLLPASITHLPDTALLTKVHTMAPHSHLCDNSRHAPCSCH